MAGIRLELELDDGQFTTRMLHAGESVRQFQDNLNRGFTGISKIEASSKSFLGTMRDLTVVVGLAGQAFDNIRSVTTGWAGDIIRVNADMERLNALMRSMSTAKDTVKDAANQVKYLRDFAKDAPFSLRALSDTFVKLKSTGIDPTTGALQALVDGVAAFGGSEDVLHRASIAIQQMAGKGVIQMEELRQQLGEAIPRATELMARALGVSYATLVKQISTGTVQAKPALLALQLELERTFGGEAQRQMGTFYGSVARMKTLLQNLALDAGNSGFFSKVKEQLGQINDFLDSDAGKAVAQRIGATLASVTQGIVNVINFVIEFRNELMRTGEVLITVFAVSRVAAGMQSIVGYLQSLTQAASVARLEFIAFKTAMAEAETAQAAGTVGSLTGAAARFGQMGAKAKMLSTALASVSLAFGTIAPWLPIVVGGVLLVANAFGLFTNKTRDAWQEMEKFGATTREQLNVGTEWANSEITRLKAVIAQRNYYAAHSLVINKRERDKLAADTKAANDANLAQIANLKSKINSFTTDVNEAESQRYVNALKRHVSDQISTATKGYDDQRTALTAHYYEELKIATKAHQSTKKLDEDYAKNGRAIELQIYDQQLAALHDFYSKQADIIASSQDEIAKRNARAAIVELNKQIEAIQQQRDLTQQMQQGVPTLDKPLNEAKILDKGKKKLAELQSQIADYHAEIDGAHGETAKLIRLLQQPGKVGALGTDEAKALTEQLIAAQEEAAKLKDLLEGKKKFDSDVQSAQIKVEEKIYDLQTKNLNDYQKIVFNLRNGKYQGMSEGPGGTVQMVANIRDNLRSTTGASDEAAKSFRQGIFSDDIISRGKSLLDIVNGIAGSLIDAGNAARGIKLPEGGIPGGFQPTGGLVGGSFVDRLIAHESGGKAGAVSATGATGLGQFIKSTWMQFLDEMYPGLAKSIGTTSALALRTDPGYSREAISWYAGKNASDFKRAGIDPSDANLYLAHFMGSGDAIKVLSTSVMREVKGLINPRTYAANKSVFEANPTAGEVINWAKTFMGSATSFTPNQPNALNQRNLSNSSTLVESTEATRAMQKLEQSTAKLFDLADKEGVKEAIKEIGEQAKDAASQIKGMGKFEAATREQIRKGKIGSGRDLNPDSKMYADLIQAAKELDAVEKRRHDNKEANNKSDAAQARLDQKTAEAQEKLKDARNINGDPYGLKDSAGYNSLERQLDKDLAAVEAFAGRESKLYQAAAQQKADILQQYRNAEVLQEGAKWQKERDDLRHATMTQGQIEQEALQRRLQQIQAELAAFHGSTEERIALERQAAGLIGELRSKAANSGPIAKQMQQWSQLGDNMQQAATGWLDSAADSLASFITTGKADFKSLINSIISDMTKLALKAAFGNMFGKGGQQGGAKAGKAAGTAGKTGKAATGGVDLTALAGSFVAMHSGGVVGGRGSHTLRIHPSAFANAPRFHSGGMIKGMGLGPDEVPIIARKGEGVFTREQMAAMGNSRGGGSTPININAPVTVNANGGTPEQNSDLAKQVSKSMEATMRQVVVKELRNQMRPNGMLDHGKK